MAQTLEIFKISKVFRSFPLYLAPNKGPLTMKENFLHFLWRSRRFEHADLRTTQGEPIEILRPGTHNTHAGPDFSDARIRIGETKWAGHVEMHLKSSEWMAHGHQSDRAYDNVILHVVLEEDQPILRPDGSRIPCLEMQKRVPAGLAAIYQKLLHNEYWIPCQHQFHTVPEMTRSLFSDRLLVNRLERKTAIVRAALERNGNDWEETFYQMLARNFGLKVNAEPFEMLACSLPQRILARHRHDLPQLEALLFGQAGMLEKDFAEGYPKGLKKEYAFLRKKYGLEPVPEAAWKFLRLHPANFPTIRLAQFARLVERSAHLFSKILEVEKLSEIEELFKVKLDGYWMMHYTFGKISEPKRKSLGKQAIHLLTINTIAPFLFLYGEMHGEEKFKDQTFEFLEALPAEKNAIIRGWANLGVEASSAYQTQALLELKNEMCDKKKCLECAIGFKIMTNDE